MNRTALACRSVIIIIAAMASCSSAGPRSSNGQASDAASNAPPEQGPVEAGKMDHRTAVRTLQFSGYDWTVKSSGGGRVGPGPNYFSDDSDNVTVDEGGRLHLRITLRDGRWHCAEVVSTRSFGYGTYRFYLDTAADNLDQQVVLGMFTWNDDPAYNHREIDVEVSRWGQVNNQNGQFVVQPYTRSQNIVRFQIPAGLPTTTHIFNWKPDSVFCQSIKGSAATPPASGSVIEQHTFKQGIPRAGGENARLNLWLLAGHPPVDGKEAEAVISKFEFIKSPEP